MPISINRLMGYITHDHPNTCVQFQHVIITSCLRGNGPSFEQICVSTMHGCLVPVLFEIGSVVLEAFLPDYLPWGRKEPSAQ